MRRTTEVFYLLFIHMCGWRNGLETGYHVGWLFAFNERKQYTWFSISYTCLSLILAMMKCQQLSLRVNHTIGMLLIHTPPSCLGVGMTCTTVWGNSVQITVGGSRDPEESIQMTEHHHTEISAIVDPVSVTLRLTMKDHLSLCSIQIGCEFQLVKSRAIEMENPFI